MIPITQSGTTPDCTTTNISSGQTINGTLSGSDCLSPVRGLSLQGAAFRADRYTFTASAGEQAQIDLTSSTMDTFLTLMGPHGVVLLNDDDSGGGTNSRIPGGTANLMGIPPTAGTFKLGLAGTYTIEVGSFDPENDG